MLDSELGDCPFKPKFERLKELNKYVVDAFLEVVRQEPNGDLIEQTGLGPDCCEISLIFKEQTLWKSVFKINYPHMRSWRFSNKIRLPYRPIWKNLKV